ncbi:GRASP55/65 PDZ-like domain-containing protein [Pelagophyceae sp. CCMP2097]|nr:GRASP55/65 PDZ-like domain-containing protein [Pelagophyceae sp. CCMP2097]
MGNGMSQEEADSVGYRVLGVQPASPASAVGLVSFFDFVVACNNVPLKDLDSTFINMIKDAEDKKPLPCTIYNIKSQTLRDVAILPTRKWGGQGMLGVTIRFDTYYQADEHLVRVVEVEAGSPAQIAGLMPETDYLLGTAERVFGDSDALFDEVSLSLDKPVEFYVYNTETDEVRIVVVLPTYSWGGEGCLGASVAHGYLHRLPARCRRTNGVSIEPDRQPDDAFEPPPPLPPPPPPAVAPPKAAEAPRAEPPQAQR